MSISVKKPSRQILCEYLEQHLNSIEQKGGSAPNWLHDALDGLHALRYNEVQPIVRPVKKNYQGITPYQAHKCRMMAVGFVDLLCTKGYKAGKARLKVGKAFGMGRSGIKGWQFNKNIGKTKNSWMQRFRKKIAESLQWDDSQLQAQLNEAARIYKVANKKKKETKGQKKTD